ncbi:MAG: hypothetical protein R2774_13815 [Saprospiraceae bacterium]
MAIFSSIASCYQRRDGCLDQLAANYSISADDECSSCCTYPDLILNLIKNNGNVAFNNSDTLVNGFGQKYTFIEAKFYVSQFTVSQDGDQTHLIRETITDSVSKLSYVDDVKIINFKEPSKIIGTMRASGYFEGYTFLLGLDSDISDASFSTTPKTHPLNPLGRLEDEDGDLIQAYFSIANIKDDGNDTLNYFLPITEMNEVMTMNSRDTTTFGQPINLELSYDLSQIFIDVDLAKTPETQIDQCLKNFQTKLIVK